MFSSLPDENNALALYEEASAALDAETEDELWNPIEIIDKIKKADSKAEKLQWKKVLLEKFLDQKNPVVATQMKDFLSEDGVTELFVGFLTRPAPEVIPTSLDLVQEVQQKKKTTRTVVTPETETDVKRSFRLMKLFLAPSKEFERLLGTKLNVIVKELFKIFYSDSQGNFHHFKAVLEQLLTTRFANETTKIILHDELFIHMFDYLHESAVVDAAIDLFTVQFRTPHEATRFYSAVNDSRVFDVLTNKITNTKDNWDSTIAAEFFIKLIDRLAAIDSAAVIFTGLARTPKTIDKLFTTLTSKEKGVTTEQRKAIASVIKELLTRGNVNMATIDPYTEQQRTVPNMLSPVSSKLHDYSIKYVANLCTELERLDMLSKQSDEKPIEFSSFKVAKPFGMNRLVLTEILADLIVSSPKSIESMTPGIWRVLTSWFFEYSNNNIYHCHLWKIIQSAVTNYQTEALKSILTKNKFATGLVRAFDDPTKSSSRGFTIKFCNLIRLAADADSSQGYLRTFVYSHDVFKAFIPKLIAETQRQLKILHDTGRNIVQDTSTDLGSQYAKSLGINRTTPLPDPIPTKSATPTKPANSDSAPTPATESPASTGGSTGAAKKKKKKKKKSTGGNATGGTTSEESKEEEPQNE